MKRKFILVLIVSLPFFGIAQESDMEWNNSATKKFLSKDFEGALSDYNKCIEINPDVSHHYLNRGNTRLKLNDFNGAMEDYKQAQKLDPKDVNGYFNSGTAKLEQGMSEEAIADFDKVIELDPTDKEAYYYRGLAQEQADKRKKAQKDFAEAINVDSKYANAYYKLGITSYESKDFEDAIDSFNKVLKMNPDNVECLVNIGRCKIGMGNYAGAKSTLTDAIELDQKNGAAYFYRGEAYYNMDKEKDACSDWKIASDLLFDKADMALDKYCN